MGQVHFRTDDSTAVHSGLQLVTPEKNLLAKFSCLLSKQAEIDPKYNHFKTAIYNALDLTFHTNNQVEPRRRNSMSPSPPAQEYLIDIQA